MATDTFFAIMDPSYYVEISFMIKTSFWYEHFTENAMLAPNKSLALER